MGLHRQGSDYFFQPCSTPVLETANAVGEVGADLPVATRWKLMMKVNPETGSSRRAKFQTFGCGSAIASSSLVSG